jgi:hypothetical protein
MYGVSGTNEVDAVLAYCRQQLAEFSARALAAGTAMSVAEHRMEIDSMASTPLNEY